MRPDVRGLPSALVLVHPAARFCHERRRARNAPRRGSGHKGNACDVRNTRGRPVISWRRSRAEGCPAWPGRLRPITAAASIVPVWRTTFAQGHLVLQSATVIATVTMRAGDPGAAFARPAANLKTHGRPHKRCYGLGHHTGTRPGLRSGASYHEMSDHPPVFRRSRVLGRWAPSSVSSHNLQTGNWLRKSIRALRCLVRCLPERQ